jgi:CheY-like chemotaxis protein
MLSETDGNSESRKRIRDLENRAVQSDSISNKKHNTTNTPDFSLGSDQITRRLLLVDDSSMNRKMAMRVLQHNFSYIDQASDGREAIEMVNNLDPNLTYDVIMMDSEMPIMKGPDAVRELRKAGYTGLIIGVTGNSMESDIESFRSAGCDKVMIKPLDINAFLAFTVY